MAVNFLVDALHGIVNVLFNVVFFIPLEDAVQPSTLHHLVSYLVGFLFIGIANSPNNQLGLRG